MAKPEKIDPREACRGLDGWTPPPGREAIARSFRFRGFDEAFAFMTRVAETARRMDHHPEWFNVYNRVDVTLTTHSAGGVTGLDLELARAIDREAAAGGAS